MKMILLALIAPITLSSQAPPDLVFVNARVWTGEDNGQPWAEALAITDRYIGTVGTNEEIRGTIGPDTRVVDAGGRLVVPGFIDTHVHFLVGGRGLSSVQLRDAANPEEFVARIGEFAAGLPDGEWILSGDWDHERWGGELPRRDWIDSVTPNNPVWINRLDGHMALANSLTLELAGVDENTSDVPGGEIVRYPDGRPTGVLKDNAMNAVFAVVPEPSAEIEDRWLRAAMDFVARQGVTSVHHMGTWDDLEVFRRAHARSEMLTRIYAAVPLNTWEQLAREVETTGRGDEWLSIGMLKGFVDGSLGSHTAAFYEPFTDEPGDRGFFVNTEEDLKEWITGASEAGLHLAVHAIGDRAIGTLLDIYSQANRVAGPNPRFRVEHAQHIAPTDFRRFAELDVIASMQPYHAIDDGRWAERVIGDRIATTYAFRSLLDAGATVTFGSDWFVAPPTPLEGIYAAVTRRTLDDSNPDGWVPEQKITVEDALRAYTTNAAVASFDEENRGAIRPGMLADVVMLSHDLFAIPADQIREAEVLMTVVDGQVVFESE